MNVPDVLVAPGPIVVSIQSGLAPFEVVERLGRAVHDRPYSTPGRFSRGFFRLGGSVAGDRITLTARPYVNPGLIAGFRAMTIELSGAVTPVPGGSELAGSVSAPVRWSKWTTFVTLMIFALPVLGFAGRDPRQSWTFLIIGALILAPAWALIIRHNQRMALTNTGELTRMIETILRDAEAQR